MMHKWEFKKLADVCDRIGDGLHGTPNYVEGGGYYFVNGNNLKDGYISINQGTKTVGQCEFDIHKVALSKSTLLLSINGTIGSMALYRGEPIVLGKSVAYINCRDVDRRFCYYYFQLKGVNHALYNIATGSTIKNLGLESLRNFKLPVPPRDIQEKITGLLSSIDDKIELNNRINEDLEGMAKLLYDYWFVQFDFPISAAQAAAMEKPRLEGKPYRTSGGKMIFSEDCKCDIPENWHGKTLQDILTLQYGKALKKENQISGNFPVYGSGGIYGYHNVPLVAGPGIVVGRKGSVGEVHWSNDSFFPTDTSYYVEPKPGIELNYIYFVLRNLPLKSMNSDSAVPGLSREATYRLPAILPDLSVIADFARIASPLRAATETNEKQNHELSELRDWLLPMLMNGQVTVL
jgi:type I restriction enzyme, S subunit